MKTLAMRNRTRNETEFRDVWSNAIPFAKCLMHGTILERCWCYAVIAVPLILCGQSSRSKLINIIVSWLDHILVSSALIRNFQLKHVPAGPWRGGTLRHLEFSTGPRDRRPLVKCSWIWATGFPSLFRLSMFDRAVGITVQVREPELTRDDFVASKTSQLYSDTCSWLYMSQNRINS